ncbi:MAG TPA: YbjN domain-containing protein [Candidatus Acidoferrales bacterium]|nr:YbjN domain-containing protein [Candidatus Acidoferrales bacterium]
MDAWLADIGVRPAGRVERDGATAWDLLLDGRRCAGLRVTLIFQPGLGLIAWLPYAPPLRDNHRRAYQQLLQWNDELPFVKFGLDADLRPVLSVEIALDSAGAGALGLALARVLAVCDHLANAAPPWLRPAVASPADGALSSPGIALLERHAAELTELTGLDRPTEAVEPTEVAELAEVAEPADAPARLVGGDRAARDGVPGSEEAGRS